MQRIDFLHGADLFSSQNSDSLSTEFNLKMQRMQIALTQYHTRLPLYYICRGHRRDPCGADLRAGLQRADGGRRARPRGPLLRHLQVRGDRGGAAQPQEEEAHGVHRGLRWARRLQRRERGPGKGRPCDMPPFCLGQRVFKPELTSLKMLKQTTGKTFE